MKRWWQNLIKKVSLILGLSCNLSPVEAFDALIGMNFNPVNTSEELEPAPVFFLPYLNCPLPEEITR